jgi:serine/threonine protein kinase
MAKLYGNRWEIDRSLGQGGQADVFLVKDVSGAVSDLSVLKRIRNGKRRDRFVAEVNACKMLSHPNIIRVLDHSALDVDDDNEEKMYLVMPLMKAGSLERRVALYKDSLDSTLPAAMAMADGLGHAHVHNVVHRDVKPANILFANEDHVATLSDFGICLIRGEERATETGERVGPWDFMAPELLGGGQLDVTPSVDIYSLGKVIYYMLSGGIIVPREDHARPEYDIFARKGGRYVILARLLDRMICVLDKRIQTMGEVKAELHRISAWEEKQGTAISPGAAAVLSSILDAQRSALSLQEHNARVHAEEQATLARYKGLLSKWLTERIQALVEVLSNPSLISARALTLAELEKSSEKCARLRLGYGHTFAELMVNQGLELGLASGGFHKTHRLLLNVYDTKTWQLTIGPQVQKRERTDPGILFVPYYFADEHWQSLFRKTSAPTTPNTFGVGAVLQQLTTAARIQEPNAPRTLDMQNTLCHQTTVGKWPEDADAYNQVKEAAVERLLDRIRAWSKGPFATLDL